MPHYPIPDPLPWAALAGPLAQAEDALARLDERLATSPIRAGWIARTHFTDACASLWLEGTLAHLEDLVLHDAGMDVRSPTHEITRAHTVLRTRRRIAEAKPEWALSEAGLDGLRGRGGKGDREEEGDSGTGNGRKRRGADFGDDDDDEPASFDAAGLDAKSVVVASDQKLADILAAVDAANARAARVLAGDPAEPQRNPAERDPLVYDLDWDEDARLAEWRAIVDQTRDLPPTLAAALAADAWAAIEPLQHSAWLGRLLAAALLRERGKTRAHLPSLHAGLKAIPRERRLAREAAGRIGVALDTIAAAAEAGLKNHDRWATARMLLSRKLEGRRSTSNLPALVDYVLARPIVSAGMIAKELAITPRAAQDLVGELGLREVTGRGRYRAWGIL